MSGESIRIGIIACEILKKEIEELTKDDPDIVHREYLEFALHVYPEEMRRTVIDKVDQLEGKVDAVFIGYAVCQSLSGVPDAVKVPSVMLEGDDCLAVLLGPVEYCNEKAKCTGTWFSSPGWAEKGVEGVIKELHLDSVEGIDPMYFMDIIFQSYSRCLFIDTGIGDKERYEAMTREFAEHLRLKCDSRTGTLENLRRHLRKTKDLAAVQHNG